ncbi:MAG: peptide-methionine (R)-S-oxide reductase [Pseudomonadota bacterium]
MIERDVGGLSAGPKGGGLGRRDVLLGTVAAAAAIGGGAVQARELQQCGTDGESFAFLDRTEAEWRTILSDEEYRILRDGGTERVHASDFSYENLLDIYHCRGCGAELYRSEDYVPMDIGFVFFAHSVPNAVLTGIDETDLGGVLPEPKKMMEGHCRCCGSHLGHLVAMGGRVLHCVNGTSLSDAPTIY